MTDGSSQGLFVVVAVVIFGIFVAISYLLFRDTLTPSLASIFEVSLNQGYNQTAIPIKSFTKSPDHSSYFISSEDKGDKGYNISGITGTGQEFSHGVISTQKGKRYRISTDFKTKYALEELGSEVYKNNQGANIFIFDAIPVRNNIIDGSLDRVKLTPQKLGEYSRFYFDFVATSNDMTLVISFAGIRDGIPLDVTFKNMTIKEIG